jgi:hypothetical protein
MEFLVLGILLELRFMLEDEKTKNYNGYERVGFLSNILILQR